MLLVVTTIETGHAGMLAVTTEAVYGHERTSVVRPDRRFPEGKQ